MSFVDLLLNWTPTKVKKYCQKRRLEARVFLTLLYLLRIASDLMVSKVVRFRLISITVIKEKLPPCVRIKRKKDASISLPLKAFKIRDHPV